MSELKNIEVLIKALQTDIETVRLVDKNNITLTACKGIAVEAINRCIGSIQLMNIDAWSGVSVLSRSAFNAGLLMLDMATDQTGESIKRYMAQRHKMETYFNSNPVNNKVLSEIPKEARKSWKVIELMKRVGFTENDYKIYRWLSSFEHCDGFSILAGMQFPETVKATALFSIIISLDLIYGGLLAAGADLKISEYNRKRDLRDSTSKQLMEMINREQFLAMQQ